MKHFGICVLVVTLLFVSSTYSQQGLSWIGFTTKKGDFYFSAPDKYDFVKTEGGWHLVATTEDGLAISVQKSEPSNPQEYIKGFDFFEKVHEKNKRELSINEFLIRTIETYQDDNHSYIVYAGSKKDFYVISIGGTNRIDSAISRIRNSLRFSGMPIVTPEFATKVFEKAVIMDALKLSPAAEAALKRKCPVSIQHSYEPPNAIAKVEKRIVHSRALLIIENLKCHLAGLFPEQGKLR